LVLSPDPDEHLVKITEGRLPIFAAEVVPDYLRTKPDPAAENRMNLHEAKANAITTEQSAKQVAQFNKIVTHVYDLISKARDEWDIESMHRNIRTDTCNQNDTQMLVKAVGMGIGLKGIGNVPPSGMLGMAPMQPVRGPGPVQMSSQSPVGMQVAGKLPSSIKTNIKSAQLHPYR
jgi:mediator of RNA polymerase II transcription subunit 8